jgi:hypothetical protein
MRIDLSGQHPTRHFRLAHVAGAGRIQPAAKFFD